MCGLFRKKKESVLIDPNNVPRHIGFIMDGNGRWATRRGLPRTAGHRAGVDSLTRVLEACNEFGVEVVSVYAFSTENYKRKDEECKYIFKLIKDFIKEKTQELIKHDTRLIVAGDLSYSEKLDEDTKTALINAVNETKDCKTHTFVLCFSYGGRHEITQAVNRLIKLGKTEITESDIESELYTKGVADPDLIVRASGEQRTSNYLMWQSAYAELMFVQDFWPDFDKETVKKCIQEYQKRNRRFGNAN